MPSQSSSLLKEITHDIVMPSKQKNHTWQNHVWFCQADKIMPSKQALTLTLCLPATNFAVCYGSFQTGYKLQVCTKILTDGLFIIICFWAFWQNSRLRPRMPSLYEVCNVNLQLYTKGTAWSRVGKAPQNLFLFPICWKSSFQPIFFNLYLSNSFLRMIRGRAYQHTYNFDC